MCVGWTVAWVTGDGQHFAGDSKSVEPKHWNYSITFSKIAMPSRKKPKSTAKAPLANLASGGIQAKVKGRNPSRQRTRKVLKSKSKCETKEKVHTGISPHLMENIDSNNIVVATATLGLFAFIYAIYDFIPKGWDIIFTYFDGEKASLLWFTLPVLWLSEIPLIFFTTLDILKLKKIDKFRVHYTRVEEKRPRKYPTKSEIWDAFKVHCQNFFGVYSLTFIVGVGLASKLRIFPYAMSRQLPKYWFFEFLLISFAADCLFYWLHRLVHHPKLYKLMHKKHHEWIYSFALAHHYMSWEEALLFMLPPVLPPVLLGTHIAIMWVFMFWVQLNAIIGHSAFCLPYIGKVRWLPFLQPQYHDLHHLRFNVNYGAMYPFTDMLFGTYRYEKIIYVDGIDPKIVSTGSPEAKREDVGVEKSRALPNVHDGDDPWEHPEIKLDKGKTYSSPYN